MAKTKTTKATTTVAASVETAPVEAPVETQVEVPPASEDVAEPSTESESTTSGRVKWFNNKAGYGFITLNDCETNEERDMFVHHSEIKVEQTQYKYLVQGEYVEFIVGAINRENKLDVHATNVRGINGGKLMCETRNEVRTYRASQGPSSQVPTRQQTHAPTRQAQQTQAQQTHAQSSQAPTRQHTQPRKPFEQRRPQLTQEDQTEWMVVPRRRTETIATKPKNPPRQRQPQIEIA
jgi:cold shock CspA family protein